MIGDDEPTPPTPAPAPRYQPLPEYVQHVRHGQFTRQREAWCGASIIALSHFVSADHALNAAFTDNRYVICPACAAVMVKLIQGQTWEGPAR